MISFDCGGIDFICLNEANDEKNNKLATTKIPQRQINR